MDQRRSEPFEGSQQADLSLTFSSRVGASDMAHNMAHKVIIQSELIVLMGRCATPC